MATMAALKLALCLTLIGCVLGGVTAVAIRNITSAKHATVTLRVAHLELFWAKIAFRDPAVDQAQIHFNEAWSQLHERRYERSVSAAYQVLHEVRGIREALPSHYSGDLGESNGAYEDRRTAATRLGVD
jgi:hypothetical protein